MHHTRRLSPPRDPRWLIDWFFERFIHVLAFSDWKIVWKKRLRVHAKASRRGGAVSYVTLRGLTTFETETIFLNASSRSHPDDDTLLETLVHELGHVIFGSDADEELAIVPHEAIYELEGIVTHLTPSQKNYLLMMLPERPQPSLRTLARASAATRVQG